MKHFYSTILLCFFLSTSGFTQEVSRLTTAIQLMKAESPKWSTVPSDLDNMILSSEMYSKKSGVHYVYLQQTHEGIPIQNAIVTISIGKKGELVHAAHNLSTNIKARVETVSPSVSMEDAIMASVLHLGIEHKTRPKIISRNDEGQPVFHGKKYQKQKFHQNSCMLKRMEI
ncbi:MAG: hypothetical protein IPG79_09330 [Saprospiraceae bacterium]|nr:hypothetical protein [Saprospiraceae bacterium]